MQKSKVKTATQNSKLGRGKTIFVIPTPSEARGRNPLNIVLLMIIVLGIHQKYYSPGGGRMMFSGSNITWRLPSSTTPMSATSYPVCRARASILSASVAGAKI